MVLGLPNKKLILGALILFYSCQNSNNQYKEALFVNLETTEFNEVEFKVKITGPVENMYWGNQLFINDNNNKGLRTINDLKFEKLEKYPILAIENRDGDIRVFSDYLKNIEYPYSDHDILILDKFIFSLAKGKTKSISFKTPFQRNHFFINVGKEEKEIRLHYVQLLEKDGVSKNILYTSNWISLPLPSSLQTHD